MKHIPFLQVKNLVRIYQNPYGETVEALKGVSFEMQRGEFAAVMGTSGCGKSTLLHLIAGVDTPTAGEVILDGVSLYAQPEEQRTIFRRRQIGLVYQFYNLVPLLTVEENLTLPLMLDGKTADSTRVDALLQRLGMLQKRNRFPAQLSGGQQQRIAIARALISRPALLLADEPTGNLDSAATDEVMQLLCELNQTTGQTILMITHDESLALQTNRILKLHDGQIVKDEVLK